MVILFSRKFVIQIEQFHPPSQGYVMLMTLSNVQVLLISYKNVDRTSTKVVSIGSTW